MGRRNHVTTTADRSMFSTAALSTGEGGTQARSDETRLQASFPASPLWDEYDEDVVTLLRYRLVTNQIGEDPAAPDSSGVHDAAAYWGAAPWRTFLDYSWGGNAPDLDGAPEPDWEGKKLHSNLGPNLIPPPLTTPTTEMERTVLPTLSAEPPFIGNGKANPSLTSIQNKAYLVNSQLVGNTPIVGGSTQPGSSAPGRVGLID